MTVESTDFEWMRETDFFGDPIDGPWPPGAVATVEEAEAGGQRCVIYPLPARDGPDLEEWVAADERGFVSAEEWR